MTYQKISSLIWNVCDDVLRGVFKQHEYGDVILPFVVLRRLDCVLKDKKEQIIRLHQKHNEKLGEETSSFIHSKLKIKFSNYSRYDLDRLQKDPANLTDNFNDYLNSFSTNVAEIINNFALEKYIEKLKANDKLLILIQKFTDPEIDLHPSKVDNHTMGQTFEELLRKFSEMSNATSGEHYTPRDVVNLLVSLIFSQDIQKLNQPDKSISIYDPCCGTGGMLTISKKYLTYNTKITPQNINLFGQELNSQTYSICKSDFLITDEEPDNIKLGSTLSNDQHNQNDKKFEYMITNPPFGVSWKAEQTEVKKEAEHGRFAIGTPRVSDGSLLFLQHMISKMETSKNSNGSRIGIVFNGSPLFTGDSGSGESEIRKWIIQNDWLETIIALPDQLFFNTGISTYIWIVTNKKSAQKKNKVQLINGSSFFQSMRKSLGDKRKQISDSQIQELLKLYTDYKENQYSKIYDNDFFGYTKITVEQPLLDEKNNIIKDKNSKPKPDPKLRDYERVPLNQDIEQYFQKEVRPHLPNAWIDHAKNSVGYEINFTKYFYKYQPLRSTQDITKELQKLDKETENLLQEIL